VVSTPSSGGDTTFSFTESGESRSVSFYTPAKGEGVAGILIADPCINEGMGKLVRFCTLWDTFNTIETIPGLLNAFMGRTDHSRIHFWGTLGDNWYDSNGQGSFPGEPDLTLTTETNGGNIMKIYDQLSDDVLSTYQLMVPGNHDLWDYGSPGKLASESDNGGWGHAQYYAMDTMASTKESPFLWSPEPNGKGWSRVAPSENFNFYHQMGNLGLIGFNGGVEGGFAEIQGFFEEACSFMAEQDDVKTVMVMSHWDVEGSGAAADTSTPGAYDKMKTLPGCKELDAKRMLKFTSGHIHCNVKDLYGYTGTGFRVAGMGMWGELNPCSGDGCKMCKGGSDDQNFGIPIVDTTEGKFRFWYFDLGNRNHGKARIMEKYRTLTECVSSKGWRECLDLATLWHQQDLA